MTSRMAAVAILALGSAISTPAIEPPPIRLDVIVTDRNDRPIRDLTTSDFEMTDAGESRPVDGVALQSSRDGRVFAVFLDEYHVQAGDNTDRVRAALAKFVETELRPNDLVAVMKPLDPLNSVRLLDMALDRGKLQAEIEGFAGRKGNYAPTTAFERNFMSSAPGPADASRAQVVSSGLQSLATRVGAGREGRKSVLLVSEGFPSSLSRGSDRLMGGVRAIVYAANRYEVAIYPVDPLAADGNDPARDASTLQALADQTGGQAASNHADLMPAFKQAAADLDDYYVVTYRPASSGDGKFHAVQVRVKRAGAQVRVRSGYWSANADLSKLASEAPAAPAVAPFRAPHASLLIHPWIGTARGTGDLTDVTVAWEPGRPPSRNQRVASVNLKVTADDGQILFDGPVASHATFSATPGTVRMEMAIRGLDGRILDVDYRGLQVPNLRVAHVTIGTLRLTRTLNAREFAADAADPGAPPSASSDFSRAERLLVRVPVYAPGDAVPAVTATLQNRAGAPMRTLDRMPQSPGGIIQFDLPLSSFAPDDYRLDVKAAAGGEETRTVLVFHVGN